MKKMYSDRPENDVKVLCLYLALSELNNFMIITQKRVIRCKLRNTSVFLLVSVKFLSTPTPHFFFCCCLLSEKKSTVYDDDNKEKCI